MSYHPNHPFNVLNHPQFPFHEHNNPFHRGFPFAAHPAYTYGRPAATPYNAPSPTPATDFDEEERIALAHLASIQRRREEAEVVSVRAREAAVRARIQAEREAAIRAEVDRELAERQRELAARQREVAIAKAQRERELALEVAERHREIAVAQAQRQRELAAVGAERARRQHALARQANHEERTRRHSARRADPTERRGDGLNGLLGALLGLHIAQSPAEQREEKPAEQSTETEKVEKTAEAAPSVEITAAVAPAHSAPATESAPAPTAAEQKDEPAFPEDLNHLSHFLGLRVEPLAGDASSGATISDAAKSNKAPRGLNELLSRFGLEFEPFHTDKEVEKDKKEEAAGSSGMTDTVPAPSASSTVVTEVQKKVGESTAVPTLSATIPDKVDQPEAAASTEVPNASTDASKADKRDTPITSFLNEFADIPAFVRDILSNVEIAFAEGTAERVKQHQSKPNTDKGKGVAEGENRARSAPAPTPTPSEVSTPDESTTSNLSLDTLNHIWTDLSSLKSGFTFPTRLTFSNATSEDVSPPLLFNRINSPYHSQAHKLLQLLLQADSISSGGDKEVRKRRKEVVKDVEGAIEELEKKRDGIWLEVKERRDKGEVESEDEDGHSSGSSVVDTEEIHTVTEVVTEHVATPAESASEEKAIEPVVEETTVEPATEAVEEVERTEVAEGFEADECKSVYGAKVAEEKAKEVEQVEVAEHTADEKKGDEKEEGYELI